MRRFRYAVGGLAGAVVLAGCSTSHAIPPATLMGIAAATSTCQHILDATSKSNQGDAQGLQSAMDAAYRAASDAAQTDARWKQFAADVYAVDQGSASADQSKHIIQVCAQLQKDSSYYVTASP